MSRRRGSLEVRRASYVWGSPDHDNRTQRSDDDRYSSLQSPGLTMPQVKIYNRKPQSLVVLRTVVTSCVTNGLPRGPFIITSKGTVRPTLRPPPRPSPRPPPAL